MRDCPVCSSRNRVRIWSQYFLKVKQDVYQCSCGMVYSESPDVDYINDSVYACPEVYGESENDRRHYRSIAGRVSWEIVNGNPVLDIGCSTGGLLNAFTEIGIRAEGIDLSLKAVNIARSKELNARCGNINSITKKYDMATLAHVLEHVPCPAQFLSRVNRVLNPDGILYIEVPDRSRYSMLPGLTQGFNLEHINHFRMCDLVRLCKDVGMEVISSGRGDFESPKGLYPAIWVMVKPYVESVQSYVDGLEDQMQYLGFMVTGVSQTVAVWGLGQLMMTIFGCDGMRKVKVVAATDTNTVFHGKKILGVEVVPPLQFNPDPDVPILICSQLKQEEILVRIKELGLPNRCLTLPSSMI